MLKKSVTLTNVLISNNETLKIGLYLDAGSDLQLPEGFNSEWDSLLNSEILRKLSIIVVGSATQGAFMTGHSPEGEPFKILVKNQTGEDQSGLLIQISER